MVFRMDDFFSSPFHTLLSYVMESVSFIEFSLYSAIRFSASLERKEWCVSNFMTLSKKGGPRSLWERGFNLLPRYPTAQLLDMNDLHTLRMLSKRKIGFMYTLPCNLFIENLQIIGY